mgnify:CR=1 FL=1
MRSMVEGYGGVSRRWRGGTPPSAACGVCHLPICRFAENKEDRYAQGCTIPSRIGQPPRSSAGGNRRIHACTMWIWPP